MVRPPLNLVKTNFFIIGGTALCLRLLVSTLVQPTPAWPSWRAASPSSSPNAEGNRTTPSVVAFSKDGERMVGQVAKRQAVTNADRTIISIKRHMGSDYRVNIDGKPYSPQEISAMILQKLKADAEAYLVSR